MSNNPDEIRRDIEATRAEMSNNVNQLTEQASPRNVAERQKEKVREGARNLKENVFGSPDDHNSGSDLPDRVEQGKQQLQQAPDQLKRKARGNPVAAGLIAFGVGALVGGLLPTSEQEKRASQRLRAEVEPLAEDIKPALEDSAESLKESAQDAAERVKQSAKDSGDNLKDEARGSQERLKDQAQDSRHNIKDVNN